MSNPRITVKAAVSAHIDLVWQRWTQPEHITQWNHASEDWHCPEAVNDLREGGRFSYRMASRDGQHAFDFCGVYTLVQPGKRIHYSMDDGRTVEIQFEESPLGTQVTEVLEAENIHPVDMQQAGWQAILDNFKRYAES